MGKNKTILKSLKDILNEIFYRFALTKSQSGGIGRHVGFKIRCSQGRVGSSPTFGTITVL